MKKFFLGAALASAATAALAADMPRPVYHQQYDHSMPGGYAPIAFSWTGFYAGINVGYMSGNFANGYEYNNVTTETRDRASGAIYGGQIGYNRQIGQWMFGLESDFQKTLSVKHEQNTSYGGGDVSMNATKLDYLGTTRLRAGVVAGDTLAYLTGGVAYGSVLNRWSYYSPMWGGSSSWGRQYALGYAGGAGVERKLLGNWTGKLEYLYVHLGTAESGWSSGRTWSGFDGHLIRAGLNYKFSY